MILKGRFAGNVRTGKGDVTAGAIDGAIPSAYVPHVADMEGEAMKSLKKVRVVPKPKKDASA